MHFNPAIAAGLLAFNSSGVIAAPMPQLASEVFACNYVLSCTDNSVGYGVSSYKNCLAFID